MTTAEAMLAALLPRDWRDREPILVAARWLDRERGDGVPRLLHVWIRWRDHGELPRSGVERDLVAGLAHLLGGVGVELRDRPKADAVPPARTEPC